MGLTIGGQSDTLGQNLISFVRWNILICNPPPSHPSPPFLFTVFYFNILKNMVYNYCTEKIKRNSFFSLQWHAVHYFPAPPFSLFFTFQPSPSSVLPFPCPSPFSLFYATFLLFLSLSYLYAFTLHIPYLSDFFMTNYIYFFAHFSSKKWPDEYDDWRRLSIRER